MNHKTHYRRCTAKATSSGHYSIDPYAARHRRLRHLRRLYQERHPGLQTRRDLHLHHAGRRLHLQGHATLHALRHLHGHILHGRLAAAGLRGTCHRLRHHLSATGLLVAHRLRSTAARRPRHNRGRCRWLWWSPVSLTVGTNVRPAGAHTDHTAWQEREATHGISRAVSDRWCWVGGSQVRTVAVPHR